MANRIVGMVIVALFFYGTSSSAADMGFKGQTGAGAQGVLFSLQIIQGNTVVAPQEGMIRLAQAPFKIRFKLTKDQTVYANFSRSDALYNAVKGSRPVATVLGFGGNGFAERPGNLERAIYMSDAGWHVWPVNHADFMRFDSHLDEGQYVVGDRTVESVYDTATKQTIALSEVGELYFVYCDVVYRAGKYEVTAADAVKLEFK